MKILICFMTIILIFGINLFDFKKAEELNDKNITHINIYEANKPIRIIEEPIDKHLNIKKTEIETLEIEKIVEEIKKEDFETAINNIEEIENKKEWFLKYKELVFKYSEWIDVPETVFDMFTKEEVNLIYRMVETECYQQDFDSKVNVANVAFNRLDSGKFGDSMKEIITSPHQFAYGRTNISEDTILAVQYAFECEDTTQGALFFHSNEKTETFYGRTYIDTDNAGHHFY